MSEYNNDLYWHALNYRTAGINEAEAMWQELQACVNRLVDAEREACANLCESFTMSINGLPVNGNGVGEYIAESIRSRKEE